MYRRIIAVFLFLIPLLPASASEDILIADFESTTYGEWQSTGEAFGTGPARGTLPGQMQVTGYHGERLVNSFWKGDGSTGTLTSPPINIERDYCCFLIGGGGYPDKTCIQLLLGDTVVRTAVGPNTQPGGSERLELACWDVRDLRGKQVTIRIVDRATGGWGHVNIDHIVLTNDRPEVPVYSRNERSFQVAEPYLVLPIKNGAQPTDVILEVNGRPVRHYSTELATDPDAIDWYAFFTIERYRGQPAKVVVDRATEAIFELVRQSDTVPGADTWYTEKLRPQFHFSQKVGWNNDPNGMVYHDGWWHLFFQHNPVGWNWGNMTWGHARSADLVHWEQMPNVLFPKTMAVGDCFSGGGAVDINNTAGWKTGAADVLVVFLTDTGAGESVAYSNDGGRTFTWYEKNPVVRHRGRDPKVIWYAYDRQDTPLNDQAAAQGGHWVMAVYDEHDPYGKNIAFYTSMDLKQWQEESHLPGYFECPEIFELPVDGDPADTRWIVFAADARYAIGQFDGRVFTPDHDGKHQVHWGCYYASQTFSNAPDNRRIQMGWVRIPAPGMPFNQTFSFPHELTLRTTGDGIRLFAQPVQEIEQLHRRKIVVEPRKLMDDSPARIPMEGELFDMRATFAVGDADSVGFHIGGDRIAYHVESARLNDAPLAPRDGCITLQILVDRTMLEVCGNDGRVFITAERSDKGNVASMEAFAEGGEARLIQCEIFELKSIWNSPGRESYRKAAALEMPLIQSPGIMKGRNDG